MCNKMAITLTSEEFINNCTIHFYKESTTALLFQVDIDQHEMGKCATIIWCTMHTIQITSTEKFANKLQYLH
jgi:hypothetical protein